MNDGGDGGGGDSKVRVVLYMKLDRNGLDINGLVGNDTAESFF